MIALYPHLSRARAQVWEMYKKAEASFWTAEELDLAHDQKVSEPHLWARGMEVITLC